MPSKSYWRRKKEKQRERGRRGAEARWAKKHQNPAPVRTSIHVEVEVRHSDRPTEIIRMRRDQMDDGRWSRFHIQGIPGRPRGTRGSGLLIAALIA
jgi:hypothetical protein